MADKDLDFDEIDKAVNDVMGTSINSETFSNDNNASRDVQKDISDPEIKDVENNPQTVSLDPPSSGTKPSEEYPIIHSTSAPISKPSSPRPNVGRFMDVIHPSADMGIKNASREDPPVPTSLIEKSAVQDVSDLPTLTPFLPDANEKVEKRPLGGSLNQNNEQQLDVQETVHNTEINNEANDDASAETRTQLDTQLPADPSEATTEQDAERMKILEIESKEVTESHGNQEKITTNDDTSSTTTLLDQESHKTQDSGANAPASQSAIYDVNDYHQPLQHSTKQKSGWLTVVAIIMIIVVGAGLAAVAFFVFGLGN